MPSGAPGWGWEQAWIMGIAPDKISLRNLNDSSGLTREAYFSNPVTETNITVRRFREFCPALRLVISCEACSRAGMGRQSGVTVGSGIGADHFAVRVPSPDTAAPRGPVVLWGAKAPASSEFGLRAGHQLRAVMVGTSQYQGSGHRYPIGNQSAPTPPSPLRPYR